MTEKYTVELNGMNCPICNKWGRVADSPEEMLDHHPKCTSYTPTSTGEAEEGGEFAVTWVPTDQDHRPWLITPAQVAVSQGEWRGVCGE